MADDAKQAFANNPKAERRIKEMLDQNEAVLWSQKGKWGTGIISVLAFGGILTSMIFLLSALAALYVGLSIGEPTYATSWTQGISLTWFLILAFAPLLMAIVFIRALNSSVHVLTQKRLILTNERWANYSLKVFAIRDLRIAEGSTNGQGDCKVLYPGARLLSFLPPPIILMSVQNPEKFRGILDRYQTSIGDS